MFKIMPASKERKYRQNGGMFFLVDGEYSKEYETMESSELYDLFVKLMQSATSIRILSEFSLYGFVFEVSIDPAGPIKIMCQTRSDTGDLLTPKRSSKRQRTQQLTSFCLKIVGIGCGSRLYTSLDGKKTKNKSFATFAECELEVDTTRYVWDRMTRDNCAEVVPDAGFGVDITGTEFRTYFKKFITTPHNELSHVIQWIIDNFSRRIYLTVMEMAIGCDTLSAYIDRMERPTTRSIAQESIKNASIKIVSYHMAMWIRTGIITTDGHSKNVVVGETGANIARGIHEAFIIYLLDLGRTFNRKAGSDTVIKKHLSKIFTTNTQNRIDLRPALLYYLKCSSPLPELAAAGRDAARYAAIDELTEKFSSELEFVASLEALSSLATGLNIDQVKRAFGASVLCDIIINASDYDHDYPQCVTVIERAFDRKKITNVSFLSDPFTNPADNAVFVEILSGVNRLLLHCHPGEVLPSLRKVTPPATPRVTEIITSKCLPDNIDEVGGFVEAQVVRDDGSKSSDDPPAAAVKRSSSSSSDAAAKRRPTPAKTSSPTPGQIAFFNGKFSFPGGSRKTRRHKIRRVKHSRSRSKHLRRSRNEKRRMLTRR